MRTGQVVIGANYGDEGKGLMTDFFASLDADRCAVVRFNGGAQAGHTVVSPDGRRHVFSHFGSASFLGCPTYLSRFFIVNPLVYAKELAQLNDLGVHPAVYVDPGAFLTTPYDIFINQLVENRRGGNRHGSCGLGINETVTRCLRAPALRTTLGDINKDRLVMLGTTWMPNRLAELAIDANTEAVRNFVAMNEQIVERFIADVRFLTDSAAVTAKPPTHTRIIFEGAQGLLLDEDRLDMWPHLTRSKTGLANVVRLAQQYNIETLDVTYVTRTYLTRHGAGPLSGENDWKFADNTNVPNQFQGTLRFAPLDSRQLNESIAFDLHSARSFPTIRANVAVTCADQHSVIPRVNLPIHYMSYGPRRIDVKYKHGSIYASGNRAS